MRCLQTSKMVSLEAEKDLIYKKPDERVMKIVLKVRRMRKAFQEDMTEMKGQIDGDLERKRAKKSDKDDALDMLEKIAGMKKDQKNSILFSNLVVFIK